jgi:hypothetical protein
MLKYDVETKRRGRYYLKLYLRRGPLDPDVEWDCMDKTLQNLIHFTCEQMVSDSFKKYCYPIVD